MRALFLSTAQPHHRSTGGEIATHWFADALEAAGHSLRLLAYQRPGDADALPPRAQPLGRRPIETDGAGLWTLPWLGYAFARGLPYSGAKYDGLAYRRTLRQALGDAELVFIDHAQLGFLAPLIPRSTPLIHISHNVEAQLYAQQAAEARHPLKRALYRREAATIARLEAALAQRSQGVWALTEHDAAHFEALGAQGVRAFELPGRLVPVTGPLPAQAAPPTRDVCMLGTWSWAANYAGLRWYVEEVHPLLPPSLQVHIGGKGAEGFAGRSPNLHIHGFVDDAETFVASARALAIPATQGAGVQIKTLDAIASGLPLVTTATGLRGISAPPPSVHRADTPAAFAEALVARCRAGSARDQARAQALSWSEARRDAFLEAVTQAVAELRASA